MSGQPHTPNPGIQPEPVPVDFTAGNEARTGEDLRRRGWFWAGNEINNEYGPLLGPSGIGVYTTYVVWTDQRENSPHHGFAFPSLNSQAAFYGIDRVELITINRLLVTLGLIEIRKQMTVRTDEHGRKWRVPHNLYRVKDRFSIPHLTTPDVVRVLELAEERKEVYRHIRHILTSSFTPMSRDNAWHQILRELETVPVWQRLRALATEEEARFSNRARAGHAARGKAGAGTGDDLADLEADLVAESGKGPGRNRKRTRDTGMPEAAPAGAGTGQSGDVPVTVVSNQPQVEGETIVELFNYGLATSVEQTNQGLVTDLGPIPATSVEQTNHGRQTSVEQFNPTYEQANTTTRTKGRGSKKKDGQSKAVTSLDNSVTGAVTTTGSPLSQGRRAGSGDRAPWNGPDREAALVAFGEANNCEPNSIQIRLLSDIAHGINGDQGWAIVAGAIYEAVDSGSDYVAPKRIREIIRRWQEEGFPPSVLEAGDSGGRGRGVITAPAAGSPVQERAGAVTTAVTSTEGIAAGAGTEGSVAPAGAEGASGETGAKGVAPAPSAGERLWFDEAGIGSDRLWAAVVEQVERQGLVRANEVHDYLRSAMFVGRIGERGLRLGVRHPIARQKIERKWRPDLEDALALVLGGSGWELEVEVISERQSA